MRQLVVEEAGDDAGPSTLVGEYAGIAYEKRGDDMCFADALDPGHSLAGELEPAAQLPSLFGAEEAGTETVNGAEAAHYTFDERALGEAGLHRTVGELWLASEGGYVLRFSMTTTGDVGYFDENTGGALMYDYELTEINTPVIIEVPADCPPGLVDAPMLADATNVEKLPGLLQYQTAASVEDAGAFYEQELATLGWELPVSNPVPEGMTAEEWQLAQEMMRNLGLGGPGPALATPTPNPDEAFIVFHQGEVQLWVQLSRSGAATQVVIQLVPPVEPPPA
jgi:hypothetical protein